MRAGKKIASGSQRRSIHHNNAIEARRKRGVSSDPSRDFKAPGSRNKKKTGGC